MDNASKALIIAGAVLIAVMLVSIGVMVYNAAADVIGVGIDQTKTLSTSVFNKSFQSYMEKSMNKANAKSLVEAVKGNNLKNVDHYIHIDLDASTAASYKEFINDIPAIITTPDQVEVNTDDSSENYKGMLDEISKASNVQFYAISDTDDDGFINTISIFAFGTGGDAVGAQSNG